jgi:hypothetical protein
MAEFLEALFVRPIQISGIGRLAMLLPLTLSVSIVYKTIRCRRLRSVPLASLTLCFTIVSAMMLIGVLLWLVFLVAV